MNVYTYTDCGSASIYVYMYMLYELVHTYIASILYCLNKQHVDLELWSNWCTVCVTCNFLNLVI